MVIIVLGGILGGITVLDTALGVSMGGPSGAKYDS
jgi:hypothetical protein